MDSPDPGNAGIVDSSFAGARVHRECGSLGAGSSPASLEETTALRIPTTPWTLCGFSSCGYQELGAWGPCGWWLRGPPPPRPQRLSSGPAGHGGRARDLLLANRRPSTVWISTVLGEGSPSGLAYPSSDCATG